MTTPAGFRTETITKTGEPNVPPSHADGPGNFNVLAANLVEKVAAVGQISSLSGVAFTDDDADFLTDLLRHQARRVCVGDVANADEELITSDACDRVALAHHAEQAARNITQ